MPLILFILSALVLGLEVLETKIFAHSLENSLIFLVVGVVLLGFGAGGSILSLRKELPEVRPLVRNCLWTTAVLLVVAHVVFAQYSDRLTFGFDWWTAGILAALAAPYVSAGMAISAMLAEDGANVHRRYGINLAGSAVGCLLPFALLGPLSGPQCLMLCAIICAVLGAMMMKMKPLGLVLAALFGVPVFVYADALLPYKIQGADTGGQLALIEKNLEEAIDRSHRKAIYDVLDAEMRAAAAPETNEVRAAIATGLAAATANLDRDPTVEQLRAALEAEMGTSLGAIGEVGRLAEVLAMFEPTLQAAIDNEPEFSSGKIVEVFDKWDPTARVRVHKFDVETTNESAKAQLELSRWFTQDSSYGSPLLGLGLDPDSPSVKGVYERSCYGVGYFREMQGPRILIIGLGGAPDVQTALHHDASEIDCVDINATTVEMVRTDMAEYLGDPYGDERVTIHLSDGRSYVRSTEKLYDLIQLSGVDTKSVLASGTLALNESYLYTSEAFDEYVARLDQDGVLVINYAGVEFRRRLMLTAAAALDRDGAKDPTQHMMLVQQNDIFSLIVKRAPFDAAEVQAMKGWIGRAEAAVQTTEDYDGEKERVVVWAYELLTPGSGLSLYQTPQALYLPRQPLLEPGERWGSDQEIGQLAGQILPAVPNSRTRFVDDIDELLPVDQRNLRFRSDRELLWAIREDARRDRFLDLRPQPTNAKGQPVPRTFVRRYLDRQVYQLAPAPDKRPFFFNTTRNREALASLADNLGVLGEPLASDVRQRTGHYARAFTLLIVMSVLALVLILGPLPVLGLRGLKATQTLPFAFYFAALGAGFIFAMSGLIQRYVLFLGHQAFAFSVVIGGLLVSAGIGSSIAGAWSNKPRRTVVVSVTMIWIMLAGIHLGLDELFSVTAGLERPLRVLIAVGVLVPLGIPLGAMFPTGLACVKERSPLFVPWAFGINGVFSVIGSSIVLPGALILGFPSMAVVAAVTYGFAMLIGLTVMRRSAASA
ncbi:MAG: hypothetical protein AAF196_06805 [Planctomycetota bacterium]